LFEFGVDSTRPSGNPRQSAPHRRGSFLSCFGSPGFWVAWSLIPEFGAAVVGFISRVAVRVLAPSWPWKIAALVRAELNFADLFVSRELKRSSVFCFFRISSWSVRVFSSRFGFFPGFDRSHDFNEWQKFYLGKTLADYPSVSTKRLHFSSFLSTNSLFLHLQIATLRLFCEEKFSLWHFWAQHFPQKVHFALIAHPIVPDLFYQAWD
jgi:hypothetical protein